MDEGNDDVFSVSRDVPFSLGSRTTDNVSDNVSVDGYIRFRSTTGRRRGESRSGPSHPGLSGKVSVSRAVAKRQNFLDSQISVSLSKLPGPIISFNDRTGVNLNFAEFMRRPVKTNPNCTVMLLRRVYTEYNVR